ncbi:MAG: hypothetical protein AAGH78_16975 [Cyanobacteria bacterium P01_H01_bin.58]
MTPARFLTFQLNPVLISQFLTVSVVALGIWLVEGIHLAAAAESERSVVSLPIYGEVFHGRMWAQAQGLAEDEINRQFSRDAALTTIEVAVVGDYNGELVPILTIAVSRNQWLANPQVSAWIAQDYSQSSHALLQRHEESERDEAIAAGRTRNIPVTPVAQTPSDLVDRAYDEGRLSGDALQRHFLDSVD